MITQTAARAIINQKRGGRTSNFVSGVSGPGEAMSPAHALSRSAVESSSRVAAVELALYNIPVNTVSLGLIDTQPKVMAESTKKWFPALPLARHGEPKEGANIVYFLASEASSYDCGSLYVVDGAMGIDVRASWRMIDDDPRYD